MSSSDQSIYTLRYNQLTKILEGSVGSPEWHTLELDNPSGGAVALTNGHVLVGNASNVATDVAMSGAVAITNTGVTSLDDASVTGALITGYVSGAGVVAASDTILEAINKLNGNAAAISTVANAALPSASFTSAAVTGKLLTGYVSGAGVVAATDTILEGINKLNGNDALKLPLAGGTMTGVITYPSSTNAAATGTVTPAAATGVTNYFYTVTGDLTINGPASGVNGQKITFRLLQDGTGHTVTFATGSGNFRFGTDITSFTASAANLTDYVGVIWNTGATRWDIVSVVKGF